MKLLSPFFLRRARAGLLLGILGPVALASIARACDSCNVVFREELAGVRAGSLVAADVRKAMENQRGLNLDGIGSPQLAALQAAEGATTPPPPVVRRAAPAEVAVTAPSPAQPVERGPLPDYFAGNDFIEIIERDHALSIPMTSYVPQNAPIDKSFTIELTEGQAYIGNGVVYDGFLTNGTVPGPTLIMNEGDVIEFNVVNKGTVPHGASIHAAYTQTSKYVGKIMPGETKRVVFRANTPGVYMYHCAPGGHAIPMHVLFGQYGMMVVQPKKPYRLEAELGRKPDVELFLVQHEFYDSGKGAVEGKPRYVTFNGKLFRYVEEPIKARPGDYVRINFINIGPNLLSTFHIVGIIWDYVYWQGNPDAVLPGGQTVTAGPSDTFVIEFRIPPDEGAYTMLSHAVGSTSRGAIGLIVADRNNEPAGQVLSDGPMHAAEEMAAISEKAVRTISPFRPGSVDLAEPAVYGPEVDTVTVQIIGNSYWPKVIQIAPGTKVRWVNEDSFAYLSGEYSGIHNVSSVGADENGFNSPLLAHGESFEQVFPSEAEFRYICTPHPYMEGRIIVKQPKVDMEVIAKAARGLSWWVVPMVAGAFVLSAASFAVGRRR
jgi:nitrite reductase (NO-forming)